MDFFANLIANLGLLSLAAVSVFVVVVRFDLSPSSARRQIVTGLAYGVASALVISFPIQGPLGATFDTRAAPVLIASSLSGPLAGSIAAAIAAAARYELGGAFQIGGTLSPFLYLAAGLLFRRAMKDRPAGPLGFAGLALLGTIVVTPAFFIGQGWETGSEIVRRFWLFVLFGNLLGVVLLGLLVGLMRDFALQKRRSAAILETASDGIVTLDDDDRIVSANPAAARLFGLEEEAAAARPIDRFVKPASDAEKAEAGAGPASAVHRVVRADGAEIFAELSESTFDLEGIRRRTLILHDLTDLMRSRAEMHRLLDALGAQLQATARANETKNAFLANMSHELRTPLNAILGFSELIESRGAAAFAPEKLDDYIAGVRTSGEVLLRLVNDVMDITRIEKGESAFEIQPVDLQTLSADVVRSFRPLLTADQRLALTSDGRPAIAAADPAALMQCVNNLVSNALKHGPPDAAVELRTEATDAFVRLLVMDNGPGVPESVLERLGDPFVRGEEAMVRGIEGAGLGLAITRRLIEGQNGALWLGAGPEGGCLAILTLPKAEDDPG